MTYERILEEVKKISPYAILGKIPNDKRGMRCLTFVLVPIDFLIKIHNADKFWAMVTRYLKGKTTEIENGMINVVMGCW